MIKFILPLLLLCSCADSKRKNSPDLSTEPVDTILSAPKAGDAEPKLFESAFIKGSKYHAKDAVVDLYGINIGNLKVPSGRIIACDPGHIDEYGIPFTFDFPKGEFPVQLSIANLEGEESVAFARIKFSDEAVVRWGFAMKPGEKPLPVGGEEMHGYSTDLSAGIFIDAGAAKILDKEGLDDLDAPLYQEMNKHNYHGWRFTIYNFDKYNLAAFSSGFGDGFYATYIGYDANGMACRLLTDFRILDWKIK